MTENTPTPVKSESRICFGIDYYESEEDALRAAETVAERGDYYNGGIMHGVACGRETARDYTDENGRRLYAVTRG